MPATIEIPQEVFEQWKSEYLATQLKTVEVRDAYGQWVLGYLRNSWNEIESLSKKIDEEIGNNPDEEAIFLRHI